MLWVFDHSVWHWIQTALHVLPSKSASFEWKLQSPMQIIPSNPENFSLTVNLTTELVSPCDRYSSVKNNYTLPQSFSHATRLKNAVGENSLKEKKTKLKARTCEDQTQEYNSVNITRIRRALYGPAAPDWQAAWRLACRTEGGQVYSLAFLFICGVICLWLRSSEECL